MAAAVEQIPDTPNDIAFNHWNFMQKMKDAIKDVESSMITALAAGGTAGLLGFPSYVKVSDVKAVTTAGGTFTQDVWQTRILNTEDNDPDGICSLSSNQITLAAGTYECKIRCPAIRVDHHQARLRNITAGTTILLGNSAYTAAGAYYAQDYSVIKGRFTIAASQVLEVQHRCGVTRGTDGFGTPANVGVDEVYTVAEFRKVG